MKSGTQQETVWESINQAADELAKDWVERHDERETIVAEAASYGDTDGWDWTVWPDVTREAFVGDMRILAKEETDEARAGLLGAVAALVGR